MLEALTAFGTPMKFQALPVLVCLAVARGLNAEETLPTSRVVKLLQSLQEKLEHDLKNEEKLYKKYECWYKKVKEAKTASNTAANARIEELEQYIRDITAGKFEFTTERVDLEKQIDELTKDLEKLKEMRDQENKDYVAARDEMLKAIAALDEAIRVLESEVHGTFAQTARGVDLVHMQSSLRRAMELGRGMLNDGDTRFLEDLASKGVPVWRPKQMRHEGWGDYEAQSKGILATLQRLQAHFTKNLQEAEQDEAAALQQYNTIKGSKDSLLESSEQALVALVRENGARQLTKSEAQAEVDALELQVQADEAFLTEVENSYKIKSQEWVVRQQARNKEIAAMSEAIAVLHSDEARDTFKLSYASQGYSLLQVSSSDTKRRNQCAARLVQSLAGTTHDPQLSLLSWMVRAVNTTGVQTVITKIDELIVMLRSHETQDLRNKEQCEKTRATETQAARMVSLDIDSLTDDIERARSKVVEVEKQIEEQEGVKKGLEEQLEVLNRTREDEKAVFEKDAWDDQSAVILLERAMQILQDWDKVTESDSGAKGEKPTKPPSTFLQVSAASYRVSSPPKKSGLISVRRLLSKDSRQPVVVEAGRAPPPPPPTWEGGYVGSRESEGIMSLLSLLKDDIQKDITAAEKAETEAIAEYDKQYAAVEGEITATDNAIASYLQDKASHELEESQKTTERTTKKGELDSHLQVIKSMEQGCDYLLVNFNVRTQKRHAEIDGLVKAKAILQGADFPDTALAQTGSVPRPLDC